MAKRKHTYWLDDETHVLIKSEAVRLSENGAKVSEADVIALAVVKWCSVDEEQKSQAVPIEQEPMSRERLESVIRKIESRPAEAPPTSTEKPKARAESVAERKAREAREHAAALAESDVVAKMTGRDDIEYDLENAVHKSAFAAQVQTTAAQRNHYEVAPRKVKQLARPCGSVDAKRRRDQ